MTDADRKRLATMLGMLGSSHAGERDAAGLKIEALRRKYRMTWAELLAVPQPIEKVSDPPHPSSPPESPAWTPPPPPPPSPRSRHIAEPWEGFWCAVTITLPFAIWGGLFWLATLSH